jgi:glycosyltransferase involved in cell wall biosynthesis
MDEMAASRICVFSGVQANPSLYDSYSVLLHPALSEGRPRVVLEALTRGLLVIGGDAGDIAEMIPGSRGIVVNSSSTMEIARALRKIDRQVLAGEQRIPVEVKSTKTYLSEFENLLWRPKLFDG